MRWPTAAPEGLAELLDKYQLLLALHLTPGGRTAARRAALREVAARFPAALREWEGLPLAELQRRRDVVAALLAAGAPPGDDVLPPWLRYARDLHPLLRALLQERRAAGPIPGERLVERAYQALAARHGVSIAEIKRALFTPGR